VFIDKIEDILRQLYSFYKNSPKRQAALATEAVSTRERQRLDREADCLSAIQLLEDEMDIEVQEGKVRD